MFSKLRLFGAGLRKLFPSFRGAIFCDEPLGPAGSPNLRHPLEPGPVVDPPRFTEPGSLVCADMFPAPPRGPPWAAEFNCPPGAWPPETPIDRCCCANGTRETADGCWCVKKRAFSLVRGTLLTARLENCRFDLLGAIGICPRTNPASRT